MTEAPSQPIRDVADIYDEPGIAWALRSVGTHLHPGSEDTTVALADRAAAFEFPVGGRVLDVASALGGPARYLARRLAATVICVDAGVRMHSAALAAHRAEGMALRCPLVLARTERLPLQSGSCDAAWSQDALCHMHKPAVVQELARVLRPGALFAFTDWIARNELPPETRLQLADRWSFPSLLSITEYIRLLDACGFEVLFAEDRTPIVLARRLPRPADHEAWESWFAEHYGGDELARQQAPGELWRSLLESGQTGYGMFIARRRL